MLLQHHQKTKTSWNSPHHECHLWKSAQPALNIKHKHALGHLLIYPAVTAVCDIAWTSTGQRKDICIPRRYRGIVACSAQHHFLLIWPISSCLVVHVALVGLTAFTWLQERCSSRRPPVFPSQWLGQELAHDSGSSVSPNLEMMKPARICQGPSWWLGLLNAMWLQEREASRGGHRPAGTVSAAPGLFNYPSQ